MDKKYRLNTLWVEITRRCNKACAHCLRGDAQAITITEEMIDRIFEDVADVKRIVFGSGEALLEIQRLKYFINKLTDSTWSTNNIEVTTNGIICDREIIDIFESFCKSQSGRSATIRISNDQFHDQSEFQKAYDFYKPLVVMANERILQKQSRSGIAMHYTQEDGARIEVLGYMGRGAELVDNQADIFTHGENIKYPHHYKHRIKISGDTIPCALQISANGNITFNEEASYEHLDQMSIGNILDGRFSNLVDRHNGTCLVLCSETDRLLSTKYDRLRPENSKGQNDFDFIVGKICEKIVSLRYRAKELFPHIPAQDIIAGFPFPSPTELLAIIKMMYRHSPYYTEEMLRNIQKYSRTRKEQIYLGAMFSVVKMYLTDNNIERRYPYWLFGLEEDTLELLKYKYENLDKYYKDNPNEWRNNKIFPCNIKEDHSIDYTEEPPTDEWSDFNELSEEDGLVRLVNELVKEDQYIEKQTESVVKQFKEVAKTVNFKEWNNNDWNNYWKIVHDLLSRFNPEMADIFDRDTLQEFVNIMLEYES